MTDESPTVDASRPVDEAVCPKCGAPPSPGRWCMACGAEFPSEPAAGSATPVGGAVKAQKYACAGCGALMLWDPATSGLKCGFCGSAKGVPRDDDYVAVEYALEHVPEALRRRDVPKVFGCDRCGAQVTFPGSTVAAGCPFCGAPHVIERVGDDETRILPQSVLPFAIDQAKAKDIWRTWLGKGLFRPRRALERAATDVMRGVYVPFWTYDTKTWSRWTAEAGYHHTYTVTSNGQTRTETRTEWRPASGQRTGFYDDVLVCASKGVDERLLRKSYPFDLKAAQPYRSEYLSGWVAEEYVVELADGWKRAREEVNQAEISACSRDVPGDTQRNLRVWTQHADVTWKHLLLPLWIAAYRYEDRLYTFLVNGQTGKVVGKRPVSKLRVAVAIAVLALVVGLVVWLTRR